MIYIIAPHALRVNITSHNRIFSFYDSFKRKNQGIKVLFPSPEFSVCWFAGQVKEAVPPNPDFITISTRLNPLQRFAFRSSLCQKHHWLWCIAYFIHYLVYFKDIYYSNKELTYYFETVKLTGEDVLIVSGPPFSFFEEASAVSKNSGCLLILDYRDPWNYGYLPVYRNLFWGNMIRLMERRAEKKILKAAAAATCIHEEIKKCFPKEFHRKIQIIANGSNAAFIDPNAIVEYPEKFKIVYLGTVHNIQLKDRRFFKSISKLISDKKISPGRLELCFIGTVKSKRLPLLLEKYGLEDYALVTERLNITDTMKASYEASAFLHLNYQGRNTVYPSKHTDYLALQKTILLPQTDDGVLEASILENNAGYACSSFDEFYTALKTLWEKFEKGENMKIEQSRGFLYRISREHEAEKLAAIIKNLLSGI